MWAALLGGCDDGESGEAPLDQALDQAAVDLAVDATADATVDAGAPDAAAPDMLLPDMAPPGGDRAGLIFPPDPDQPGPHPILISLHGARLSPRIHSRQWKFQEHAAVRGVLVAIPKGQGEGLDSGWNGEHCCPERDGDDVAFLTGYIDELVARYNGDPDNVWIFGYSSGAYMAQHMACAAADRIRGIMPAAGLGYPRDRCDPAEAVSVIHTHGTADEDHDINGEGDSPGVAALAQYWAGLAGCTGDEAAGEADFERAVDGPETQRQRWTGCAQGVVVETWTMVGGQHQILPTEAYLTTLLDFIAPE